MLPGQQLFAAAGPCKTEPGGQMSIWKRWRPHAKTWLVIAALCSGVSLFLTGGTVSASLLNTFKITGAAKGTLRFGPTSTCSLGMGTLAKSHGELYFTDLVGSVAGFKTVLTWGFDVVAPKDGTYKLSAGGLTTGHTAQLTAGYKTGKTIVFNVTGGTMSIKRLTGSINAKMAAANGKGGKTNISFVGSWSCKS